ncbi:MAG: sulfate permease [Pseudomonadales bacterium]|nr:sulfate permease [Pseudomonadales bacterium]
MNIPIVNWAKTYQTQKFAKDIVAAGIVVALLIPQSLAYAMVAGVTPQVGLYASILPLIAYAIFGSSTTLSVGPVAVISLMTATALGNIVQTNPDLYLTGAVTLALLSGIMLIAMGILKFGFVSNFLSHSVVSGFVTASCIIIALSQLENLFGIESNSDTTIETLPSAFTSFDSYNFYTVLVGLGALMYLGLAKRYCERWVSRIGLTPQTSTLISKLAPLLAIVIALAASYTLSLETLGVEVVGEIPQSLPTLMSVLPSFELVQMLAFPALMISIVGYVESISVSQTLAAKRREYVDPNQELIGLGAANLASGISGAIPVAGGFSRSAVNFDAGAVTQAASIFTAIGIAMASLLLPPIIYYLPKAVLAATIIIAVIGLIDLKIVAKTWAYSKSDFSALIATLGITLVFGVEIGIASGVFVSLLLHIYRTSKPHIAEVGLIEGTEHFRNVERYHVLTSPKVLSLRQDESLFFANAAQLARRTLHDVYKRDAIAHVVIQCNAVNEIDFSALEMLEDLNQKLIAQGVTLNLSEVKGPVMDKLQQCDFCEHLSGRIYLSQYEAFNDLV